MVQEVGIQKFLTVFDAEKIDFPLFCLKLDQQFYLFTYVLFSCLAIQKIVSFQISFWGVSLISRIAYEAKDNI